MTNLQFKKEGWFAPLLTTKTNHKKTHENQFPTGDFLPGIGSNGYRLVTLNAWPSTIRR